MNRTYAVRLVSLLAATLAVAGATLADEPQELPHMALVRQLGASSYAQRESAAQKLLEIGIAAKPALIRGMELDDLEIRLGAHRILVQVMQSDFDTRITAFLNDRSADGTYDLPGWPQFREQVGDSDGTRHLFADMLRAENDLIAALGRGDTGLEQLLADRIQFLTSSRAYPNGSRQSLTGATLAAILFAGTQAQKSPKTGAAVVTVSPTTSRIYSILNYTATKEAISQGAHAVHIRKLLAGWIDGLGDSQEQYGWSYAMQLTLKFDLREQGPQVARKVLKNPGTNTSAVPYAAIVLGRFGTADDAKELEPHLGNTQVFHTWSNMQLKKEPIRIQARDAVLAMIIRLHGEDPADYGFKLLQEDDQTIYKVYTMGFLEDADRDAALAKWEARGQAGKEPKGESDTDGKAREASEPGTPASGQTKNPG